MVAMTKDGWKNVQLDNVVKLQKEWKEDEQALRADAFFGTLKDGRSTPTFIMNVYRQGAGTDQIIDDNCDVWNNIFTTTTKDDGNEFFKYLKKHGFNKAVL